MAAVAAMLDFRWEQFQLFLIYKSHSSYQVSSNWLFGSGEEIPNRFSNGGHGGHLGFQIGMTLVIFFSTGLSDSYC